MSKSAFNKSAFATVAILAFSHPGLSWAAGQKAADHMVTGRITYIDAPDRQFMIDNAYTYTAAPGVNLEALSIAERVSLSVEKRQRQEVATEVTAAPLSGGSG